MKCEICGAAIAETFLKKPKGGYFKDAKGKLHLVCFACQKRFPAKPDLLKQLKK
jgi:hypothetical protein